MLSSFVFLMTLINALSVGFLHWHAVDLRVAIPNGLGAAIGIAILWVIRDAQRTTKLTQEEILALI